ncbi:hypothetical protein MMC13_005541 [Lambiella insularis]|nr:hypothetical protein [Lambiella insularis]
MRAWIWYTLSGPFESRLTLSTHAPLPPTDLKPNQVLVRVLASSLNPADYKFPEVPVVNRLLYSRPATPGMDYCGRIVAQGSSSHASIGTLVFGRVPPLAQFGTLGEYVTVDGASSAVPVPQGIGVVDAASITTAALTSMGAMAPYVKPGDRVFINGGSGAVGTMAIQIARALGCSVTVTCSGRNVVLCRGLGAELVIDYREKSVLDELEREGKVYKLTVDLVGDDNELYRQADRYLVEGGGYVQVAMEMAWGSVATVAQNLLRPMWLGGGKRPWRPVGAEESRAHLERLAGWMSEGRVRAVIDETFAFDDVPKAYEKLKTGRAKGKIVVKIGDE